MSSHSRTLTYHHSLSSSCLPSQPLRRSSRRQTRPSPISFRSSPLSFLSFHISAFWTLVNTPADPDKTSRFWTVLILVLSAFPSAFPYLLLSIFLSELIPILSSRRWAFRIWQYWYGEHTYGNINTEISLWIYQCLRSLAFGVELLLDIWEFS